MYRYNLCPRDAALCAPACARRLPMRAPDVPAVCRHPHCLVAVPMNRVLRCLIEGQDFSKTHTTTERPSRHCKSHIVHRLWPIGRLVSSSCGQWACPRVCSWACGLAGLRASGLLVLRLPGPLFPPLRVPRPLAAQGTYLSKLQGVGLPGWHAPVGGASGCGRCRQLQCLAACARGKTGRGQPVRPRGRGRGGRGASRCSISTVYSLPYIMLYDMIVIDYSILYDSCWAPRLCGGHTLAREHLTVDFHFHATSALKNGTWTWFVEMYRICCLSCKDGRSILCLYAICMFVGVNLYTRGVPTIIYYLFKKTITRDGGGLSQRSWQSACRRPKLVFIVTIDTMNIKIY